MILWTSCRRISTCETVFSRSTVKQKKHKTTKWQFTFPLISCSTMFSGLRSLCMILFSCRYWIPDPGAESSGFTERWGSERHVWMNKLHTEQTLNIPTSLSNESTSLSFKPQQFSGLLSIWNPHKYSSITSAVNLHYMTEWWPSLICCNMTHWNALKK